MYVTTSKAVYAYQCLQGASGKIQTIGMNFIAPVNCLLPDVMDEISDINRIAGVNSNISAITIIASTTTPNNEIIIRENGVQVTTPAPVFPAGTSDWKTFYVTGLTGEVDVNSSGPIAVGTFMSLGSNAGLAGYFSGFDTVPFVGVSLSGGGCFPSGDLEESTGSFDAYQWYFEGNPISGATSSVYTPTQVGNYFVEVTDATCTYSSSIISVYNCNPDVVLTKTSDITSSITDDDVVNFTVKVESFGVNPVTNLVIQDVFPSQLDIVNVTPSFGTWNSPNWTIGTMNPGDFHTINFEAKVPKKPQEGTFTNTVSNTQDQTDTNATADDLTESFTIVPQKINLALTKTVSKAIAELNSIIEFTITLKNNGPNQATGVEVKDLLPPGLSFDATNSVIPVNTTYNANTGIWDLSALTITSGQTLVLKIAAVVNTLNINVNTSEVFKADQIDVNSTPNSNN